MGSVNRASLRAEFDGLKGQFEALCAKGRISVRISAHRDRRFRDRDRTFRLMMTAHFGRS
jgi:hypothetical protein